MIVMFKKGDKVRLKDSRVEPLEGLSPGVVYEVANVVAAKGRDHPQSLLIEGQAGTTFSGWWFQLVK